MRLNRALALLLPYFLCACLPGVSADPTETNDALADAPHPEFDPENLIVPFPNNLVLDPTTGKVNVPAPACGESGTAQMLREQALNALDGFGTYEVGLQVTFTTPVR